LLKLGSLDEVDELLIVVVEGIVDLVLLAGHFMMPLHPAL